MATSQTAALTASGTTGHPNVFSGIAISETGGTSSITVSVFDGTDNTGKKLFPAVKVAAGQALGEDFSHPIRLQKGNIYVQITGSGTADVVVRGY